VRRIYREYEERSQPASHCFIGSMLTASLPGKQRSGDQHHCRQCRAWTASSTTSLYRPRSRNGLRYIKDPTTGRRSPDRNAATQIVVHEVPGCASSTSHSGSREGAKDEGDQPGDETGRRNAVRDRPGPRYLYSR